MKHLKNIFNVLLLLFTVLLLPARAEAQKHLQTAYMDSVEVSLLTCQPHDEIYSLYGHTALRWHDLHDHGTDYAFNYGVFNFHAPYFTIRFVFGMTDYELGAYPFRLFQQEYRNFGSMVTEQVLNLTATEKQLLYEALNNNIQPENSVYRYNYFYNNCTTKARDIIEQCIQGKVEYEPREDYQPTYRDMVHEMTRKNPWAAFGNDLLLGIAADKTTNQRQQEFLPHNLMYDFDHAKIYQNGQYRPLVKERRLAVPAGVQTHTQDFPLSPYQCALLFAAIGTVVFLLEWRRKRPFLAWDILLMLVTGAIGIVLFLMLFSQHPTVSINLQIILFNPLPFFYLWPVIKGRGERYWQITVLLAILFLVGSLFQHYAEGIAVLALFLLLQSYIHLKRSSVK